MPSSSSSSGRLVKVAYAQNQAEAEMIQGLLNEHGIPSMLKRAPGFDVPEFLAAGPCQVFVAAETAEAAREALEGMPGTG
jgi:putative signal transducing protein